VPPVGIRTGRSNWSRPVRSPKVRTGRGQLLRPVPRPVQSAGNVHRAARPALPLWATIPAFALISPEMVLWSVGAQDDPRSYVFAVVTSGVVAVAVVASGTVDAATRGGATRLAQLARGGALPAGTGRSPKNTDDEQAAGLLGCEL
jgi:hypothetical protein